MFYEKEKCPPLKGKHQGLRQENYLSHNCDSSPKFSGRPMYFSRRTPPVIFPFLCLGSDLDLFFIKHSY